MTMNSGRLSPHTTSALGLEQAALIAWNLAPAQLYECALATGEARLADGGALVAETGSHTGRSPEDKFIVVDALTEDTVWWDNNAGMSPAAFDRLLEDVQDHAKGRSFYAQDLYGGASAENRIATRVFTEYAWHSLFIQNLLICPTSDELSQFAPDLTIIDMPSFKADPQRHGCRSETVIACDLTRRIILICGTSYAGEMKKSVFTVLNYLLPEKGVMPMHCSANVGDEGDTAIFFGLSGTGKTTLSADPSRTLIGDDEHGWDDKGVFNFEGGCYAKTIRLSKEAEPQIYATTKRFGTVLENVVLDPHTRRPDFDDASLTENTRCAYPIHFIDNASDSGLAPAPQTIIMLTADAFGVMPPIAKLTPAQAMYHFLSGYTAKVAGTEKGVSEPKATFSTCFGAPFMPRHPAEYGNLLRQKIAATGVNCWLVNTGWTGGAYGTGTRMPIAATRALLRAALDGTLAHAEFRKDPSFGFDVPVFVAGVDQELLNPRNTWGDPKAYDVQAARLVAMFIENFETFDGYVDDVVREAAPIGAMAAE